MAAKTAPVSLQQRKLSRWRRCRGVELGVAALLRTPTPPGERPRELVFKTVLHYGVVGMGC
jgi:hypothetical protein